ncbi:MAG: M48 family metalloprotease [Betaproteobacteria bacterium]
MRQAGILVGLALLAGCSTHPITGRDQILALPAVQAAHADASFAVSAGLPGTAAPACEQDCGSAENIAAFAARVATIGARLEVSARGIDPELFGQIDNFRVEVNHAIGASTGSSAGGRIAIGAGLARLEPTDTVIAFLIAREMAHVIARHAAENSGASIVFSALGMLLPGINVLARLVATKVGSSMLTRSWEAQQEREADDIAVTLLEHAGLPARVIAPELDSGIKHALLPDGEWAARYLDSVRRVAFIAASAPRVAVVGD